MTWNVWHSVRETRRWGAAFSGHGPTFVWSGSLSGAQHGVVDTTERRGG